MFDLRRPALVALTFLATLSSASALEPPPHLTRAPRSGGHAVDSRVERVTLYRRGAEVVRVGRVELAAGTRTIRFAGLERGIESESIRLSVGGDATVYTLTGGSTAVGDSARLPPRFALVASRLDSVEYALARLEAEREGYRAELAVLEANRGVSRADGGDATLEVREVARAHRQLTTAARLSLLATDRQALRLAERRDTLSVRLARYRARADRERGYVEASLVVERAGEYAFELSYLVADAGWQPDYDLFVDPERSGEADLVLVANVAQATGELWDDVALTLSTGDPYRTLSAPAVHPQLVGARLGGRASAPGHYRLGAYHPAPRRVEGVVRDADGEPLIGVNVVLSGTTVGTVTDFDGRYRLEIPRGAGEISSVQFTYTGFAELAAPLRSERIDAVLSSAGTALDEVVVVGYGGGRPWRAEKAAPPPPPPSPPATFAREESALATQDYLLDRRFDLPSGAEGLAVRLVRHALPLELRYRAAPKLSSAVYLEGLLTAWDTLGLAAAPMRLHLGGRYLGTGFLPAGTATDTLAIGLGADDRVRVTRTATPPQTDRRRLQGRRDCRLGYRIELQNGLPRPVEVIVQDQVPRSAREEIDVEVARLSGGGVLDEESGLIEWALRVAPGGERRLEVAYEVSAPREVPVRFE